MEWLINNWYLVVGALALFLCAVFAVIGFFKLPTDKQIDNLKEWLKLAVTQAEKELGSKTGQLKLRYVYDLAISKFSWVESFLTFEEFSDYVDEALIWLEAQLESNKAVQNLVKGGVNHVKRY